MLRRNDHTAFIVRHQLLIRIPILIAIFNRVVVLLNKLKHLRIGRVALVIEILLLDPRGKQEPDGLATHSAVLEPI